MLQVRALKQDLVTSGTLQRSGPAALLEVDKVGVEMGKWVRWVWNGAEVRGSGCILYRPGSEVGWISQMSKLRRGIQWLA